ncbi:protein kinase-like domain, Mitogen-activated protein (MAP) kinase kinase kinase 7 [Artemisia annua]|uniref:Protein kinase-like domain, Mitogen-activated protein (MAP) kinase kinase kinase 7 n=1 Tax=Artemisia annua TaxID=35608 RepID=A0A2U1PZ47_ARTAN|nr:protein kinase-like domain, Mitogen-activated protein (MAP) kinase kinase kinase 7 [Artemisia annua]
MPPSHRCRRTLHVIMVMGSSKVSSVPPTPRIEGEILQSSNSKSFSFSDLKMETRNFRPDSVLGEGGFGSVFKGWIDEQSYVATKPGTGIVIAVEKLNQESGEILYSKFDYLLCTKPIIKYVD